MVTESEFAKATVEFHLAVNAARRAHLEVDDARRALEEMQCQKVFQCVLPDVEGVDFAFVQALCGLRKGHEGPHDEGQITPEHESAIVDGESVTIRKDSGWVREMDRQSREIRASGGRPWM